MRLTLHCFCYISLVQRGMYRPYNDPQYASASDAYHCTHAHLRDNNNNNNNSNFFCANILENQAQWRDKTGGLINLIIESNA